MRDKGNLIITGFMGTGKTAVGREVARRLGRPFVDMDAEIEARANKSVPRIFAEDGEAAFRQGGGHDPTTLAPVYLRDPAGAKQAEA